MSKQGLGRGVSRGGAGEGEGRSAEGLCTHRGRTGHSHPPSSVELDERQPLHHRLVAGLLNRRGKALAP